MRVVAILLLLLGGLALIGYVLLLPATIMSLIAQPSGNEPFLQVVLAYGFFIGLLVYPVIFLLFAVLALINIIRNHPSATRFAFAPIGYILLLVALFGLLLFTEHRVNTSRAQVSTTAVAECTLPVVDGGDGLSTTGCGVLEIGETVSGTTGSPGDAHNWELLVAGPSRFSITLKNDEVSCPDLRVLSLDGQLAPGFELREYASLCPEGMTSTAFFYFNPPEGGSYILRVFTPDSPGGYFLEIK
jgi:fumarate reductase subunit D